MADEHNREPQCPLPAEILGAFLEHRLTLSEAEAVTAHVADCESCQWLVAQLLQGAADANEDDASGT